MRVVSAQLQLSTRTGPQSHATTEGGVSVLTTDLSDLSDLPSSVPPLLPLAGARGQGMSRSTLGSVRQYALWLAALVHAPHDSPARTHKTS